MCQLPDNPAVNAIECISVSKDYSSNLNEREKRAVSGLNLTVAAGEVHGFLGHNGAGKTTAIKMMIKLIAPTSGEIKFFGTDIASLQYLEGISYLPETVSYYQFLTPLEILDHHAALNPVSFKGMAPNAIKTLRDEVLALTGISKWADTKIEKFSKGMRQRLSLAACLMKRPRLLLLDEPASGLDPEGIAMLLDIIKKFRAEGRTVFFSSHHISEIERVCDRVSIIRYGKLLETVSLETMRAGNINMEERYLSLMNNGEGGAAK